MNASDRAYHSLGELTVGAVHIEDSTPPKILLEGTFSGPAPTVVSLVGTRQRLTAELVAADGTWRAEVPLLVSRWQSPPVAPRSGAYHLHAETEHGVAAVRVASALPAATLVESVCRIAVHETTDAAGRQSLVVDFAAPLTATEFGAEQQARLEGQYRQAAHQPLDAVFFESFFGQSASCNPLAIDRALAELRPDIARYWSVADASVTVPDGAIALLEGSEEWWHIRGRARLLVVNDWMRKKFKKRAYQTVLQTWHGTMLKKIALNRPKFRPRAAVATIRERARWDILLSENPYSSRIFRSAYAYFGPIWEEGYPRNDVLRLGDGAALRRKLGIPDDVTVLLYAPTWRDNRPEQVDHLDVAAFASTLGPGYLTLIRGHSRTLRPGHDVYAANVLDVTSYPDVSELFLVADALITDYSSVMFDYTVTGKPVFFFVPDLDDYRTKLRGFYFDLIEAAPGPVVRTSGELVSLIRDREQLSADYAPKYAAWQKRFNPRDDGEASRRVVNRLLAQRMIG
ncbi:MAG: CDP-glycerol glycerophosphotransferase family protein [Terrimesophilobacter sp.]